MKDKELFRANFIEFLKKEIVPFYKDWEDKRGIPRSIWHKMGKSGYLCAQTDKKFRGADLGFEYSLIISQEIVNQGLIGLVDFGFHSDVVVPYIEKYGTERQKERWLPGCCSGEIIASLAITEPSGGSNVTAIQTSYKQEGERFFINGKKTFVSNGMSSDIVIAVCRNQKPTSLLNAFSLFVIENDTLGFNKLKHLDKMGLQHLDLAEIEFDNCILTKENLLGVEGGGLKYLKDQFPIERMWCAIVAQYASQMMFNNALAYTKKRKISNRNVSDFQHNKFKLVELATEIEIGKTFIDSLLSDFAQEVDTSKKASMAKWWITELANRVAYNCLQLYGGYGFLDEYDISMHYRDIRVFPIFTGTNEMMKETIAKILRI